jgi:hypothetical protein
MCAARLLARFGPDYGLVSMRLDLAEGCPPEDTGAEHPRALRRDLPGPNRPMSEPVLQALSGRALDLRGPSGSYITGSDHLRRAGAPHLQYPVGICLPPLRSVNCLTKACRQST